MISGTVASPHGLRREARWLFGLALLLRTLVALLAAPRFPPADDGTFYHAVATRIAAGQGYTWAWPDGAVTYAAHYPVGYPALLGAVYALAGAKPVAAMLVNALLGALLVFAVHQLVGRFASLRAARLSALALALHPTLLFYTAALMTEASAAALLMLLALAALVLSRRAEARLGWLLFGLGCGAMVLVRPQLLPLVGALGAVAAWVPGAASKSRAALLRARGALVALVLALAVCAPWTLRNCAKMDACVFVSANGGWNLLIGTMPEARGSFAPIAGPSVPPECRTVFGEAGKDRCFGRAGTRRIADAPLSWLRLAPQKLGQLFNHGSVAAPYLRASNPELVSDTAKLALGAWETLCTRLLMLGACVGMLRRSERPWGRLAALAAFGFALSPWGYWAELGILASLVATFPTPGRWPLGFLALSVLALLCVTHVVFFGAARYALIWLPWLAVLLAAPRPSTPVPRAPSSRPSSSPSL